MGRLKGDKVVADLAEQLPETRGGLKPMYLWRSLRGATRGSIIFDTATGEILGAATWGPTSGGLHMEAAASKLHEGCGQDYLAMLQDTPLPFDRLARKGGGYLQIEPTSRSWASWRPPKQLVHKAVGPAKPAKNVDLSAAASVRVTGGSVPSKAALKGTGFVLAAGLPLTDEQDELDEVPEPRNIAPSQAASKGIDDRGPVDVTGPGALAQVHVWPVGTGFVATADLPLTDEEDEEEEKALQLQQQLAEALAAVFSLAVRSLWGRSDLALLKIRVLHDG
ncbi:PARC [Symbiodinium microadriaticum]|nr:PARC [Symbiodinium microadriaticum]